MSEIKDAKCCATCDFWEGDIEDHDVCELCSYHDEDQYCYSVCRKWKGELDE